ncbi:MAG TPA: 3'(2'),5'-bisphosphate nucleotidase CysQ [Devosiaceae bacterium]|jgi:3'(2'),5'-bisphosphate nucleotidase|nr:3'(2'),5'-bisphosphate nucleotidase CysQ [Devosiaceae bacterium]
MASILDSMLDAAIAASRAILKVYAEPFETRLKEDGSPVTEADAAAEAIILEILRPTGIPSLAEESVAAGRLPELGDRFFVIDALDGTKEFIKRNGEFTVNIALCERGRPVLGVVLAPVTGALYWGGPQGAFAARAAAGVIVDRRPIEVSTAGPLHIVASRSHRQAVLETLCEELGVVRDLSVGSSLKFCLLAEGRAQLYPRFGPTSEWDTAAGQAVLEAAGGVVVRLDGAPLDCGHRENDFLNPVFIAAASSDLARRTIEIARHLL